MPDIILIFRHSLFSSPPFLFHFVFPLLMRCSFPVLPSNTYLYFKCCGVFLLSFLSRFPFFSSFHEEKDNSHLEFTLSSSRVLFPKYVFFLFGRKRDRAFFYKRLPFISFLNFAPRSCLCIVLGVFFPSLLWFPFSHTFPLQALALYTLSLFSPPSIWCC